MKLVCRIDEWRFKRDRMTQAELAEKSGITVGLISAYENGRRMPNAYTLWKLSDALDCKVDQLYRKAK